MCFFFCTFTCRCLLQTLLTHKSHSDLSTDGACRPGRCVKRAQKCSLMSSCKVKI